MDRLDGVPLTDAWPHLGRSAKDALADQLGEAAAALHALPPPDIVSDERPVLLHTELMRQHLLVAQDDGGRWRFTGLFDFEPSMRGAREYEFVGLACFVAEGDARFLGRVLRAYGHPEPDGAFRRRMMAWSLLHYYSNIADWTHRLGAPPGADLGTLADRWFATQA